MSTRALLFWGGQLWCVFVGMDDEGEGAVVVGGRGGIVVLI